MKKMNRKIAVFGMTAMLLATAVNAAGNVRYKDRMFEVKKTSDVVYATDVPQLKSLHSLATTIKKYSKLGIKSGLDVYFYANETETEPVDLKMDIYTPKGDVAKKRAAVIVAHGGAMISGAKIDTTQKSVAYCDSLAARGFVAASIDYRLGVTVTGDFSLKVFLKKGTNQKLTVDSANYARAVYRGVQDLNAAVRYMRKNADKLGIDPKRIYLLGNSSGAILSIENIYANSKDDFPSYMEYDDVPNLGGLNDFGEQDVDAHANGGVLLWGAIHDPKVIKHNRTPVFLVHGDADETVLFKKGRPLQSYSVKDILPETYAERLSMKIETPTLYGSYVIDSALTVNNGKKSRPETYFVDDANHEFYDKADYTEKVQTKVFDFLYKLATENKIVYTTAAITIGEDDNGKYHAVVDGEYDGTDSVKVSENFDVEDVVFDREFSLSGLSTVTLPFSVDSINVHGAKQFLRFVGVKPNAAGVNEVWIERVWCDLPALLEDIDDDMGLSADQKEKMATNVTKMCNSIPNKLFAYTPYIVQLKDNSLSFSNAVRVEKTKASADTVIGNWIFRGTLAAKVWYEGHPEFGYAYGYSATEYDQIKVGKFAKAGKNASIGLLRSYLLYSQKAAAVLGLSKILDNISSENLPTNVDVVIVDNDGYGHESRTVIGRFNTRTGEFKALRSVDRSYDLKGRVVGNESRNAKGAYYGKKRN